MKPLASKNLRPTKKGRITATRVGQNILQCFVYNIAIIYFYYTRFLMCFNNYLQIGHFIINNLRVHIIVKYGYFIVFANSSTSPDNTTIGKLAIFNDRAKDNNNV